MRYKLLPTPSDPLAEMNGSAKKKKKKSVKRMSQLAVTLSLCICAKPRPDESWAKSRHCFLKKKRKKCVTDRTWKKLLSLFRDETLFRLKIHNFTFLAGV